MHPDSPFSGKHIISLILLMEPITCFGLFEIYFVTSVSNKRIISLILLMEPFACFGFLKYILLPQSQMLKPTLASAIMSTMRGWRSMKVDWILFISGLRSSSGRSCPSEHHYVSLVHKEKQTWGGLCSPPAQVRLKRQWTLSK